MLNLDIIKIKNIEIFANHGVLREENVLGQKFLVSVDLYLSTRKAGKYDNLEFSVDYNRAAIMTEKFVSKNTFKLIETVAENLAEMLLINFRSVEKVRVEIKKPWAPVKIHTESFSVEIERGWKKVFLSLGSNIGDKKGYLDFAVAEIEKSDFCKVAKISDFIVTKPVSDIKQDDFLNGCVEIKTLYSPFELLKFINEIESKAGRDRSVHWGPRTLDIDIIFYDDVVIYEKNLIIPHIEMENRFFVLKPLSQIAPFQKHPVYGLSVKELLEKNLKNN